MRFGVAARPLSGMTVNGDAYVIKEWNGQTLLAVIDGLGHGEEASIASSRAKNYIAAKYATGIEKIIQDLHEHMNDTRGVAAELVRIDRTTRQLLFCGIGNTETRIVGEPPMHPASLDGIIGMNVRKTTRFAYRYDSLRAVVLHSDGISGRFELSDYPSVYDQPQKVADQIMTECGKKHDDAIIVIAVEEASSVGQ